MGLTPSFWAGRRVLLTGQTGFKGAWAALWLARWGAQVNGFALPPDGTPNLYAEFGLGERIDSRLGDLTDRGAVEAAVRAADPEIVLHLAAQALVRRGYREPARTFASNVTGTVHLLEALKGCPALKAVLIVTSDKVYRNEGGGRRFVESDPLGGTDPYSASKAAQEHVARCWAESYFAPKGIAVATARAGNVIGGGDFAEDRLIPDVWRAARAGTPLELRYPEATRPWQHVLDAIAGYFAYLEALATAPVGLPRALNFGPAETDGARPTVAALAERMQAALGARSTWRRAAGPQPPESLALALDSSLARRVLGWRIRLAPEAALRWTAEWYRAEASRADMRAYSMRELEAYLALA